MPNRNHCMVIIYAWFFRNPFTPRFVEKFTFVQFIFHTFFNKNCLIKIVLFPTSTFESKYICTLDNLCFVMYAAKLKPSCFISSHLKLPNVKFIVEAFPNILSPFGKNISKISFSMSSFVKSMEILMSQVPLHLPKRTNTYQF